jgi:uncharacterized membrane protein YcaP (DUF421 family)
MLAIIIRTLILYIVLTLGIRLMGKRQIGDMQPNELVVTLVISEIAAIPLQDSNQPILNGVCSIFVLVVLEILLSFVAMKSMAFRKLMSGQSVIIIKNGVIDQIAMKKVRMTILDLVELLRGQNVFEIDDVAFAVLEVNGDLSVLLKSQIQNLTPKDVGLKPKPITLPLPIISDGKIIKETCKNLNITQKELLSILEKEKVKIKDVFLMTLDKEKKATFIRKSDKL